MPDMTNGKQAYETIINTIMRGKVRTFGELAVKKANNVSGLSINEDGKVISISGDPIEVIHELLTDFEKIAGEISTTSARAAIKHLRRVYPNLKLPKDLAW